MKEDFLHYLWQYQLFNKLDLRTSENEIVQIERIGQHNQNAGPDFLEARIKIGQELWVGSVEIHLKSSDWYVHNHETDPFYDNVILHLVWVDDIPIFRRNNTPICTLVIKGLVPKQIWNNYINLNLKAKKWIACENLIGEIKGFKQKKWLERLYVERLEYKFALISEMLEKSVNDWESVFFKLILKNFGLKVNGSAFLDLANSIDFSTLRKERDESKKLEALLLGQAGLLRNNLDDSYYIELQQVYKYQKHKYKLNPPSEPVQFFRLRPANFPTIRLAQLANLFSKNNNLFQELMLSNDISKIYNLLEHRASSYWDTHFVFGKENRKSVKKGSQAFIDLLLVNTVIPMKFAYQKYLGICEIDNLFAMLQQLKPEENTIVKKYRQIGIDADSVLESQALLTLYNTYCKKQQCLRCVVGLEVLKI